MSDVEELQQVAISELLLYFGADPNVQADRNVQYKANVAVRALSAVGRIKATERARDATQLVVLRALTDNKSLFTKYLKQSLPHLIPKSV